MNKVICPECDGAKTRSYSCCTGEHVSNDWMLCPACGEHLGEEDCETCNGTGWVEETEADLQKQDLAYEAAEIKSQQKS